MDTLTFRPASTSDIPFIAECNYIATSPYPGFCYWDPLLNEISIDTKLFIKTAIENDAINWCRVEDCVIGEINSQSVCGASLFVMPEKEYRPLNLNNINNVYKALGFTPSQVAAFTATYEQVWRNPLDETLKPSGELTIECVAVIPEQRGKGYGTKLMEYLIEKGKIQKAQSIGISVTIGNITAEQLYIKAGFNEYITYHKEFFFDAFPGTKKYRYRV